MANAPKRLGRGLSSLLSMTSDLTIVRTFPPGSITEEQAAAASQPEMPGDPSLPRQTHGVVEIPLNLIGPNPHQPRRSMDENALAQLAASIRITGIIQPIIVRPIEGRFELIAGERRLRAATLAELATIPAIVRYVASSTQAEMALIENVQREDLNPIDRAVAYRSLMDDLGFTQAELAERMGEERSGIANYLRLLELPGTIRLFVRDGKLSLGHAKLIAGVTDVLIQEQLAEQAVAEGLSVRALERLIQQGPSHIKKPAIPAPPSPHLAGLERSIAQQLGMRVSIRPSRRKGKGALTVYYATLDQFDEVMKRLGVTME